MKANWMDFGRLGLFAAGLALAVGAASAQPGPRGAAGASAPPGASASGPAGMGPRMGAHMGPGARWGSDYTPGWSMMSRAERDEHREHMRGFKDYDECKSYMDQHHEQMAARAKERGVTMAASPRRDACVGLKGTAK